MAIDRSTAVELRIDDVVVSTTNSHRVPLTLVARWFAQLAVMMRAGIPLMQTLTSMIETETHKRWRGVQESLASQLRGGVGFSAALSQHPKIFDPLTVKLIETGEQTGQLDTVLERIAISLEQRAALRAKLRQALVYPVCVFVVAVAISIFMLLYVVPQFATLFEANNATLPWLTMKLIDASHFIRENTLMLCVAITVATTVAWLTRVTWLEKILSRTPIARDIWLNAAIARWTSTMVMTLRAGLPFLQGLNLACDNAQHPRFKRHAQKWSYAIEDGASLREALRAAGIFAPWALQMMAMGQESGQLDSMLDRIAEFHLEKVNKTVATLSTLLEPAVMIVIGVLVGTMLLAMYLPIFELSNAIG